MAATSFKKDAYFMNPIGNPIGFDVESYYDTEISVKKLHPEIYARHPRVVPYLIALYDPEGWSWVGEPKDLPVEKLCGRQLVSHNAEFDSTVAEIAAERGLMPRFTPAAWFCSADLSRAILNVFSLKDAIKLAHGEDLPKTVRDRPPADAGR